MRQAYAARESAPKGSVSPRAGRGYSAGDDGPSRDPDGGAGWGEAVHAVVVPRPGRVLTAEEVVGHCRGLIAGYKCPRSVEVRAEPLPLSGAGKVLKARLREPFWAGRDRRVN